MKKEKKFEMFYKKGWELDCIKASVNIDEEGVTVNVGETRIKGGRDNVNIRSKGVG